MPTPPPPAGGIFTSEPFPANVLVVQSPFGGQPVAFITSTPPQQGSLINYSGVNLSNNKLQQIMQLGAYQTEPYEEDWTEDDSTAVINYLVPWVNNPGFLAWARGYSFNNVGQLSRIRPAQHPKYPWLYCVNAKLVKGVGGVGFDTDPALVGALPPSPPDPNFVPAEMIAFYDNGSGIPGVFAGTGMALWQLTFRQLPYAVLSDDVVKQYGLEEYHRFCERIETYALEQLSIPGQQLKFVPTFVQDPSQPPQTPPPELNPPAGIAGKAIDQSGMLKRFATRAIIYRWHDVPDVPEDGIKACVGTINSTVFDQPWVSQAGNSIGGGKPSGYEIGTLYCEAPKKERKRNCVGRVTWTIEYTLLYRAQGWLNFPAQDGNFYRAQFPDGSFFFKSSEFRQLFQMPKVSRLYQNDNF